jgi:hypothetical protein
MSLDKLMDGMANLNLETDEAVFDDVEAVKNSGPTAKLIWPKKSVVYSHINDEDNMGAAKKIGFVRGTDAFETYCGLGYETKFDIIVHADGEVMATHVNGVALVKPVKL